jgi:hypothetical protein
MTNPCTACPVGSRCLFRAFCTAGREYQRFQADKRRDGEYAAYIHDRKTAAMHAATRCAPRPAGRMA